MWNRTERSELQRQQEQQGFLMPATPQNTPETENQRSFTFSRERNIYFLFSCHYMVICLFNFFTHTDNLTTSKFRPALPTVRYKYVTLCKLNALQTPLHFV